VSCVERYEIHYPEYRFPIEGGSILEQTRTGVILLRVPPLVTVQFYDYKPKRLVMKIRIVVNVVGLDPTGRYVCHCAGGIKLIAVFVKNPFKQVADLMNIVIQLHVLLYVLQLLTSLLSIPA
jgi:hypothetical protein